MAESPEGTPGALLEAFTDCISRNHIRNCLAGISDDDPVSNDIVRHIGGHDGAGDVGCPENEY